MTKTWRYIFLIGALMLAAMAVYVIWFEAKVPEILVKSFLTLVVGGFVLTILQSAFGKPTKPDNS